MNAHIVKVKKVSNVTYNVICIETEKPANFTFIPGQATKVSINKVDWKGTKRPFTFTCIPSDDYLEFTIKIYPVHNGVTLQMATVKVGDELIIHEVTGAIAYKGEGVFIAGGAGVTPFISIMRQLAHTNSLGDNKLIFANNKLKDVIYQEELTTLLGDKFISILAKEEVKGHSNGYINDDFIKSHSNGLKKYFYVCGPPPMMKDVLASLTSLHINEQMIVKEVW